MAIFLYKFIRGKIREREAQKKAVPTTDELHLVPQYAPGQGRRGPNEHDHQPRNSELTTSTQTHEDSRTTEEAAQDKSKAREKTIRQWKLVLGLALANFLAAIDVTIVAPAIPEISSHFNRLSGSFNWIVAAYTLTFTAFVPASSQLADIFGRHFALQFELFWIMIGSVLCAAAQSWGMLLLGRALQGLGAAGIMSLSRIIMSDGLTLAESSRNNSLLSLVSGLSYSVGPVVGGYLADAGWRYLFVLPAGIAVLAMIYIFFLMRKELAQGRVAVEAVESRRLGYVRGLTIIDWPGIVMFILGIGCLILAIQWGGTQYAWSSAPVVAPLVVAAVLCIAFFGYEYLLGPGRAVARLFPRQVPMIPSTLFRKKDTSLLMVINFSAGISLVSAFYFISYYWQLAEGYSPSKAGIQLLYYTPGLGIGVYTAMILCNVWPRQTFPPLFYGSIVEAVGLALLAYSISIRHQTMVKVFLAVAGAGTGLRFMPVVLHAAGTWSTRIPAMQGLLSFMLPLGETIAISMMGSVFSNKLNTFLSRIHDPANGVSLPSSGPPSLDLLNNLPPAAKTAVQQAAARAVMWSLISVLPFVGLSVIASAFLGNIWIGRGAKKAKNGKPAQQEERGKVMYSSYLLALFTGSIKAHKQDLDVNSGHEEAEAMVQDAETKGVTSPESAHVTADRRV
ncbi:MFS general substrate transporter [Cucurbitaria berberidis CBS 394.84]|uniref:MFS general substrate transporter n=1 Tax=Cucurbitaria berberidis CBS 394.84 TaxID=1168544 RepID=A0A9P4L3U4_9PLEO|nr:MFS general substrate transporter [Cucurbitaria berberidis CBS 394.84]KAF1840755.1 MFS general substrate transporter [Cucurbitaria berberidis CBS 394.84]